MKTWNRQLYIKKMVYCKALNNLGRLNYLFEGLHLGGWRAAIIYSHLDTCRLQDIDPSEWLDEVLRK
jgi:hypothetical protein